MNCNISLTFVANLKGLHWCRKASMSEDFPHHLEYTRLLLNEFSCSTDVADFLT